MKACPACNTRYDDATTYCTRDGNVVVPDMMAPNAPIIGQLVGDRYKIIRKIGEGGMGEVYLAEHIHIEKRVALKLLRAEVLSNQEAVSRFRIEARSASSIGHDNIIQIDDFGTLPDGRVYMAMEFLNGLPLNELLTREPLPMPRALDILIQTGKGLAAAHAKGITHRDMKPENVYVTQKEDREVPKILDFGIAKVSGSDGAQNLTVQGSIFGTPFYMAPEQAMGGKMDHRVDVYAMGIIMYEVFTGTVPFKAETFMGILTQHITTPPVPPSVQAAQNGRLCPRELEAVILKALQKDPNQRYQSMNELVSGLIEYYRYAVGVGMTQLPWRPSQPISQQFGTAPHLVPKKAGGKGKGWVLAAALGSVLVAGAAIAAVAFMRPDPPQQPPPKTPDPPPQAPGLIPTGGAPDARVPIAPPLPSYYDAAVPTTNPPPLGAPDAGAIVLRPNPPPPDRPPRGHEVDVTIVSVPPSAIVYAMPGHNYICQAPCSVTVKAGQKQRFRLELGGFNHGDLIVDGLKKVEQKRLSRVLRDPSPDLKPLEP